MAGSCSCCLVSSVVRCWFFPFTNPSGHRKHPATNQMKGRYCPLANRDRYLGIKAPVHHLTELGNPYIWWTVPDPGICYLFLFSLAGKTQTSCSSPTLCKDSRKECSGFFFNAILDVLKSFICRTKSCTAEFWRYESFFLDCFFKDLHLFPP